MRLRRVENNTCPCGLVGILILLHLSLPAGGGDTGLSWSFIIQGIPDMSDDARLSRFSTSCYLSLDSGI